MNPLLAHSNALAHGLIAVAAVASVAVLSLADLRRDSRVSRRTLAWAVGIVVVLVATSPWVEDRAAGSFTAHMVQHLLLIVIAAPLLVAGEPFRTTSVLLPASTDRSVRSIRRRLRNMPPMLPAGLFVVVLAATHLTPVYDAALRSSWVHELEHAAYIGAAVALWASIRHANRMASAPSVFAVLGVIGGTAIVGISLLSAPAPLVATYEQRSGTAAALSDQQVAASIMWISGMAVTLPLLILAVWRWADREQRIAERSEQLQTAATNRS